MRIFATVILAVLASAPLPARAEAPFADVDSLAQICVITSDAALCEATVESFRADYEKARRGDYPAQRNVAYCLETGCDGAVAVWPVLACAWRMVIQASDAKQEPTEGRSYKAACGTLPNGKRREALVEAEAMFDAIYGREMPIERLLN